MNKEQERLKETTKNWLKWGPYLSERQWGTVREDYSENGDAWNYFTHDDARSRVYRWGEDGIGGISDDKQNLCFAFAFWNGQDSILKERLFGLTNAQGNHGEDVKELYYFLENTPTHSYQKMLYKYPQAAFPYKELVAVNGSRSRYEPEYELLDTGVFDDNRYFDIEIEYAKADDDDILIRLVVHNRANEAASLYILPTLWFRNRWNFGLTNIKPIIQLIENQNIIKASHETLGDCFLYFDEPEKVLFTRNRTNQEKLWNTPNAIPFVKDAFHRAVVGNDYGFLEENKSGTKAASLYYSNIAANGSQEIRLRLSNKHLQNPLTSDFETIFSERINECKTFYDDIIATPDVALKQVKKQALAGLLWSKQYYNYDVNRWLSGDYHESKRESARNTNWLNLNIEAIFLMPDTWEYPWFAAWDLAFHAIVIAEADVEFAKTQVTLLLSDKFLSPEGQIPAYEWSFSDLNPPVQAMAALEIFKKDINKDLDFLEKIFDRLLVNYHWWLRREDTNKNNLFTGGFLGLDNISVFDRSNGLPQGATLEQADATAWMALFSLNMLEMAIELSQIDTKYDDYCVFFFQKFTKIAESLHTVSSVWADSDTTDDGFFYDVLRLTDGRTFPIKIKSLVGVIPALSVLKVNKNSLGSLPKFKTVLDCFNSNNNRFMILENDNHKDDYLFSLLTVKQLESLTQILLDENEMLGHGGVRSLSKVYENGFGVDIDGQSYSIEYVAGESTSGMYGGNSNWRGPVWKPINYLIVKSLEIYSSYFLEQKELLIHTAPSVIKERLLQMFLEDKNGHRPIHGQAEIYKNEHFKDLILFYEHFHAETSRGLGASHQTGWTALIASLI